MSNTSVKYTYQDLLTAPDDRNRYEIFEGELIVTPSPTPKHQNVLTNLMLILGRYVHQHASGKIFSAPLDVYFDDETVVEPDLLFINNERLNIIEERRIHGAPDLVVEILSPNTADRDRGFKFRRYAQEGIQEYWLVDPDIQILEINELGANGYELNAKFTGQAIVTTSLFPGLEFPLTELWK